MNNKAIGDSWDEVRQKFFTKKEIEQSNRWVKHIGKKINNRKKETDKSKY